MREGAPKREKARPEPLPRQFEHIDQIHSRDSVIEAVDVTPEKLKDEVPIFFAPGWAGTTEVYGPMLKEIANEGHRVLSLNHPRTGGNFELNETDAALMAKYPKEEVRKALNVLDVLRAKEIKKTDVIATSEGALNLALAALLEPDRFRSILFYAGAGLIGDHGLMHLAKGNAAHAKGRAILPTLEKFEISEEERAEATARGGVMGDYDAIPEGDSARIGATYGRESAAYIKGNFVRAVKELLALSTMRIDDIIPQLHEKGIGVIVVAGADDPLFPADKVQELLNAKDIDGFMAVRGGHAQIGDNPEKFVAPMVSLLETYAQNQKKQTES